MRISSVHNPLCRVAVLLFVLLARGSALAQTVPSFLPTQVPGLEISPTSIALGDFNRDGKPDLAVVGYFGIQCEVLLNRGDGGFNVAYYYTGVDPGQGLGVLPATVVTGDFNGDGKLDLAMNNTKGISVLLGNGDGTFQPVRNYTTVASSGWLISLSVGDFNRDGKLDLVVANSNLGNVSVLLGNGDGTFQREVDIVVGGGWGYPNSVVVGDFNGDGKLDLAVIRPITASVDVLLGNGDGSFHVASSVTVGQSQGDLLHLWAADLNGDGKPDLILVASDNVSMLLGKGDGRFLAPVIITTERSPTSVVAGDFNGDGKVDLAMSGGVLMGAFRRNGGD